MFVHVLSRYGFLLLLPLLSCLVSCEELLGEGAGTPEFPSVEYQEAALTDHPSSKQLASYFCKDLLDFFGSDELCKGFFGKAPKKSKMKFNFLITFNLENPNSFAIPLVELLLALDVFKGANNAELGAVCVSFCDPDSEEECDPAAAACEADEGDIRSLDDINPSTEDLLELATDVGEAVIEGELPENLQFKVIPAAEKGEPGKTEARINFQLNINTMLSILKTVAKKSLDDIENGDAPSFDIPYAVDGTLFFDLPGFGRVAIDFGPFDGTWEI